MDFSMAHWTAPVCGEELLLLGQYSYYMIFLTRKEFYSLFLPPHRKEVYMRLLAALSDKGKDTKVVQWQKQGGAAAGFSITLSCWGYSTAKGYVLVAQHSFGVTESNRTVDYQLLSVYRAPGQEQYSVTEKKKKKNKSLFLPRFLQNNMSPLYPIGTT